MNDLAQTAGRCLLAGFDAGPLLSDLAELLREDALGGVILFRRNIGDPEGALERVSELLRSIHSLSNHSLAPGPLVAVDQEGGRVARLGPPVMWLPPMRTLGAIDDLGLTRRAANLLGRQLRALGFNCDFAPVLDVDTNPDNPVIGDRSFGSDAPRVARHGLAFAEGLTEADVCPCAKHFPGHGDTALDSHFALPSLPHDMDRLRRVELRPFTEALSIPMWMTAHVIFEALDPDVPATLSSKVITGLLREDLGYDGVVASDDLEMKAISEHYGVGDAACRAIEAGCDLLLICSKLELLHEARDALVHRAETRSDFRTRLEEAATRVGALRHRFRLSPEAIEPARAAALGKSEAEAIEAEIRAVD
ncbi:MAG: beta-N-acetylhexosaminidase [Myxococcota bacterium]